MSIVTQHLVVRAGVDHKGLWFWLLGGGFDEGDFGVGEAVELIDELVDLSVGGFDLALDDGAGVAGFGGGKFGVEVDHFLCELLHTTALFGCFFI